MGGGRPGPELPRDFTAMFDQTMFKFDTHLIPEAVDLYKVPSDTLDTSHMWTAGPLAVLRIWWNVRCNGFVVG